MYVFMPVIAATSHGRMLNTHSLHISTLNFETDRLLHVRTTIHLQILNHVYTTHRVKSCFPLNIIRAIPYPQVLVKCGRPYAIKLPNTKHHHVPCGKHHIAADYREQRPVVAAALFSIFDLADGLVQYLQDCCKDKLLQHQSMCPVSTSLTSPTPNFQQAPRKSGQCQHQASYISSQTVFSNVQTPTRSQK